MFEVWGVYRFLTLIQFFLAFICPFMFSIVESVYGVILWVGYIIFIRKRSV